MKIIHSARPRNRSSRNSRSPPAETAVAGGDKAADADAAPGAIVSAVPARGGSAIRSATDVIWHRLDKPALRGAGAIRRSLTALQASCEGLRHRGRFKVELC